jgi:hypothetical protein
MEWVKCNDYKLFLFSLGFEKAFDLIDWEFLFSTLKPLGFNGICGKWISSFYINVCFIYEDEWQVVNLIPPF